MADGLTSLNSLSWGTSTAGAAVSAESTLSMGVDRTDVRVPPDTTRVWGAQLNAVKNWCIAVSATFKSGTRLGVATQSSNPFGATEQGLYCDTSGNPRWSYNGVASTLLAPAFSAKGDLAVYNGSSVAVLPLGTDTFVLTADSTQPSGVKWAAGGGSLGNYTASGNNLDISVSGTMALGTGNANTTSFTVGSSSTGPILFNGTRLRMQQAVQASTTALSALSIIGAAHTAMTASTEYIAANFQLNQTYQWATGALATNRFALVQAPTIAFVGASNVTGNVATLAVSGAPTMGTNATLTGSAWALWLQSGNLGFGANAAIGQSAQSATNTTSLNINPNVADGASSIALKISNQTTLSTAGWKLLSLCNNGTEFGSVTGSVFAGGGLRFAADGSAFLDMSLNGATNIGYGSNYIGIGSGSCIFNGQGPRSDGTTTLGTSGSSWPVAWTRAVGVPLGGTLSSATTITPTQVYHKVSGTTSVTTIATGSLPTSFTGMIYLTCTGAVPFGTGGNILTSFTATTNKTYCFVFDGTNWSVVSNG